MALPVFVGLKSIYNNKYLQYVKEDGEVHGYVRVSGENLVSPYAKFKIETAKTGEGLVHIRCCYNNKYLVRSNSTESWSWVVARADEPEEDKSKWSCTLFEPLPVDGKTFRFRHVQLGDYACLWRTGDAYDSCLNMQYNTFDQSQCDVFTIIDWESLCILPARVAFKGDNGCYVGVHHLKGYPYLQFSSTCIGLAEMNEVVTTGDGSVLIMSDQNKKFWRRTTCSLDYWIWADSHNSTSVNHDTNMMFWPVRIRDNVIALKNLAGNNLFCKRFSNCHSNSHAISNCLSANSKTASCDTHLEIKELASSRTMNNVNYHLKDARIYGQSVNLLLVTRTLVNRNKSEQPITFDVKLEYAESKSKAWNASVSPKSGVKTDIQASIPVIADGKVEISANSTGVFEWGKTIESDNLSEVVYKVTVPPMTQVKVSLLATKGSCDVPFSYHQLDTLTNGEVVTLNKCDGIYTGFNYYNFKYETKEEKLVEI